MKAVINPFGTCTGIVRFREGQFFDLYRAEMDGQPVCLKVPRPVPAPALNGRSRTLLYQCFEAVVNLGSEVYGETSVIGHPGMKELALLLQTEMEIVRSTRGAWNHEVIGMGVFESRAGDLITEQPVFSYAEGMDLWPAALMPFHQGHSLCTYPRTSQVRLFVRMLPALWDALCVKAHADISANNILIDEASSRFILIDPGVYLGGHEAGKKLFTTNAENYPLLFPHHHAVDGDWFEDLTLWEISKTTWFERSYQKSPSSRLLRGIHTRPSASDLQALGLMYYRMVAPPAMPFDPFGLREPAWCGGFVTPRRRPFEVTHMIKDEMLHVFVSLLSGLDSAAAALIRGLVLLEVKTRAQLEELVSAVIWREC